MKPHTRPEITRASRPLTFEVEAINERGEMVPTAIAGESPLTLYLDRREIVTLMTLGQAPGSAGHRLPAQSAAGAIDRRNRRSAGGLGDRLGGGEHAQGHGRADARAEGHDGQNEKRTVTTGCGQGTVFGDLMQEIDQVKLRDDVRLRRGNVYALMGEVRHHETIYKPGGAVHGCALATNGDRREPHLELRRGM